MKFHILLILVLLIIGKSIECPDDQEEIDDECFDKCRDDQERLEEDKSCICFEETEEIDGKCVPFCRQD